MKVRSTLAIIALCAGLLWLVIFGGSFLEYHRDLQQQQSMGQPNLEKLAKQCPFIAIAAQVLDYDLFPRGEYQISPGHILRKDVVRQLGFAGILISLGLILLIGPLTETLAQHRLRHFVYNASIATLGGSAALYIRITWEFTQR